MISGHVRVSVGTVTKSYPFGRDQYLLPGPSIEVQGSATGGMSGGPVFDQYGLLFGIVSSSFAEGDHVGPSYVSMLWPALTTAIDAEWPPGAHSPGKSLIEFGLLCAIDRREALRRVGEASEYAIW
jgi:hypothetical protein